MRVKATLLAGICATAVAIPAFAQDGQVADEADNSFDSDVIIVTAQRQSQSLQEVPLAVSAFDATALEAQQIENSSDLQLTLPNVTFTKTNFTSSSFTIRGVGDLCTGTSCDQATAIHLNSAPLIGTRLFETEFFDLERIEVLRGPQGTLFGRNATSGVVNVVTAKPDLSGFSANAELEYGNFDSIKAKGMINVPIGDSIAARVAGFYLDRDGYTENLFDDSQIDGRDMYAIRGSLRFEPGPDTSIDLMAYYFREDDDRLRVQKQLCQRDPTGVLGCLNNRLDAGKTNFNSTFQGILASREFLGIALGDPVLGATFGLGSLFNPDGTPAADAFASFVEPDDTRVLNTPFTPEYFTDELQLQAHVDHSFGAINLGVTGTYQETEVDSRQDVHHGVLDRSGFTPALGALALFGANGVPTGVAVPAFVPGSAAYFAPFSQALIPSGPAGELCVSDNDDGNRGLFEGNALCSDVPRTFDRSTSMNKTWSVEAIITSDLDGPFNFLLGGIYAKNDATDVDYYVSGFHIDYISGVLGSLSSFAAAGAGVPPSYLGPSLFHSNTTDYQLKSFGLFGEVYFDVTDRLKVTGGLRYNDDSKSLAARTTLVNFLVPYGGDDPLASPFAAGFDADSLTDCPAPSASGTPGALDSIPGCEGLQIRDVGFNEITGRFVIDYELSPDNLLYASYSRGYKSGGINPPISPVFAVPDDFGPETIDAFEIGSKNTFANGALQLNATAFYYKYSNLQLARLVARTAVNDTIDANIWGIELESIIRPADNWLINMNFSYLDTEVSGDQFFSNPRDPGGGDPNAVIIKDLTNASNCAVSGPNANLYVAAVNGALGLPGPTAFPADGGIASTGAFGICEALQASLGIVQGGVLVLPPDPLLAAAFGTQADGTLPFVFHNSGVETNVRGNSLPQAPKMKASAGVQYTHEFASGMTLVPRADLIFTGEQFGNIFNGSVNRIAPYVQANARIQLNSADERWFVRGFIQNIFDSNSITGLHLGDASTGVFTNAFTLDPRRYGIAIGVNF